MVAWLWGKYVRVSHANVRFIRVKKSLFEKVSFQPDLIDQEEPSKQSPWHYEWGNKTKSHKACKLVWQIGIWAEYVSAEKLKIREQSSGGSDIN